MATITVMFCDVCGLKARSLNSFVYGKHRWDVGECCMDKKFQVPPVRHYTVTMSTIAASVQAESVR